MKNNQQVITDVMADKARKYFAGATWANDVLVANEEGDNVHITRKMLAEMEESKKLKALTPDAEGYLMPFHKPHTEDMINRQLEVLPENMRAGVLEKYPIKPFYMRGSSYLPTDLNMPTRQSYIDALLTSYTDIESQKKQSAIDFYTWTQSHVCTFKKVNDKLWLPIDGDGKALTTDQIYDIYQNQHK